MKEDDRGSRRLETLKAFGPINTSFPITQSYGLRGPDGNFARGTGTFRSLHGGRMPAFARCCFRIAASLLVLTSPIRFPFDANYTTPEPPPLHSLDPFAFSAKCVVVCCLMFNLNVILEWIVSHD